MCKMAVFWRPRQRLGTLFFLLLSCLSLISSYKLDSLPARDMLVVRGDWNNKVGKFSTLPHVASTFDLGELNKRADHSSDHQLLLSNIKIHLKSSKQKQVATTDIWHMPYQPNSASRSTTIFTPWWSMLKNRTLQRNFREACLRW